MGDTLIDLFWEPIAYTFEHPLVGPVGWLWEESQELFTPEMPPLPEMPKTPYAVVSPTYAAYTIQNTVAAGIPIPLAFGKVKVGGNIIRSSKSETTRAFLIGMCEGEINDFSSVYVNDILWRNLNKYNLIVNGEFSTNTDHWNVSKCGGEDGSYVSCSLSSIGGGRSGNCLNLNRLGYSTQPTCQAIRTETGKFYLAEAYVQRGTSGADTGRVEVLDGDTQESLVSSAVSAAIAPGWMVNTTTFTSKSDISIFRLKKDSAKVGSIHFEDARVAPGYFDHSKSEYKGTSAQTADSRFVDQAQAYRDLAYLAITLEANNPQTGSNPTITSVIEGKKIAPLAGGVDVFTRDPAVILYHIYTDIEGIAAADLDTTEFQALETYCDAIPAGGSDPRYRFDYIFDTKMTVNDMKKILWQSFHGTCIHSQGKIKPVWQQSGSTVFAFTKDNIVGGSFSWSQPERPNVIRIHYINSDNDYKKDNVELRDETSITNNGEILYEENAWFITDEEIARRRVQFWYNKFKYTDYVCGLTTFPEFSKLEIYDIGTITHPLPGWSAKKFRIISKGQDEYGRCMFQLEAYHSGIYDDRAAEVQHDYYSTLPNPYEAPDDVTGVTLTEDAYTNKDGQYIPTVTLTYTKPTEIVFWNHARISVKVDTDSENGVWDFYGDDYSGGLGYAIDGIKAGFIVGNIVWVKVQSVNDNNVAAPFYSAPMDSIEITKIQEWVDPNEPDEVTSKPPMVKGLRIENKYYDYTWDGLNVTVVWRGGSATGGAGHEAAGQETTGAGGVSIDSDWKYDEVQIFIGGALRHTAYTKDLKYAYVYGDGQDDFLDHYVIANNGAITFKVYRWNIYNLRSENPAQVTIYNQNPATPIGLSSVGSLTIGEFAWTSANETDWDHYSIRTGVEGDASSTWKVIYNTKYTYFMSSTEMASHGSTATIHFDVKSVDLYGNESSINSTSVQSSAVTTTHISDNAISTPKLTANCVTAAQILANTITANEIAAGTITSTEITTALLHIGIIGNPALQNMLMNGGFEETDGTDAYYWTSGVDISTEVAGGDNSNNWLEITRAGGVDKIVHNIQPDTDRRYFEVNEGEIYEFGGSVKSDTTCTCRITLGAYDKDLGGVAWTSITGLDAAWVTKSDTYVIPAGVKFLRVYIAATITNGWAAFDNVYLKRVDELAWSWTAASDRTTIDGGNIYTNTITASQISASAVTAAHIVARSITGDRLAFSSVTADTILANTITANKIAARSITGDRLAVSAVTADVIAANEITASKINGAGFGALTLSSGTIQLNSGATIGLSGTTIEFQAGADASFLAGGDIVFTPSDSNPSLLKWSTVHNMGAAATDTRGLCMWPTTADQDYFRIGWNPVTNATARYKSFYMDIYETIYLKTYYDVNNTSFIQIVADNATDYINLYVKKSGTAASLNFDVISGVGTLRPSIGTVDLGTDTIYFNDINYKTLDDRGCLGWADDGVQLQDGKWVSDIEALLAIKKHPAKRTITGMPMIDYKTLPKPVYRQAGLRQKEAGGEFYSRDKDDEPYTFDEEGSKVMAADGAELTSLVSIMLGAIKELERKKQDK